MARRAASIPADERLVSLILALVASASGLTKQQIIERVHGYSQDVHAGVSAAALDRRFDRDKASLRDLGIPLDVLEDPGDPGNNQALRYRISRSELQLPADLSFSDRELMLMRLAVLAWKQGSLAETGRRFEFKIAALGGKHHQAAETISPEFGMTDPTAPTLIQAIAQAENVRFAYRLPDRADASARFVAPLRLHRFEGRWHLLAYDHEREAPRVFLIDRIEGPVRISGGRFSPELQSHVAPLIEQMEQLHLTQQAEVSVITGTLAERRLLSRVRSSAVPESSVSARTTSLIVGVTDFELFAHELAGYGSDVRVHAPGTLALRVREILSGVIARHVDVREASSVVASSASSGWGTL